MKKTEFEGRTYLYVLLKNMTYNCNYILKRCHRNIFVKFLSLFKKHNWPGVKQANKNNELNRVEEFMSI